MMKNLMKELKNVKKILVVNLMNIIVKRRKNVKEK